MPYLFFQSFEGPHALLFHRVLVLMTGTHKVLTRFDLSSTAFFLKFSCRAEDEAGSWEPENLEWDRTLHAEKSPLVASVRPCLSACLLPALYKKYLYTESTLNHVYIGTCVLILYTTIYNNKSIQEARVQVTFIPRVSYQPCLILSIPQLPAVPWRDPVSISNIPDNAMRSDQPIPETGGGSCSSARDKKPYFTCLSGEEAVVHDHATFVENVEDHDEA